MHLLLPALFLLCSLHCVLGSIHNFKTTRTQALDRGDSLKELVGIVNVNLEPWQEGQPLSQEAGVEYRIGSSRLTASVFQEKDKVELRCDGELAERDDLYNFLFTERERFRGPVRFFFNYTASMNEIEVSVQDGTDRRRIKRSLCWGVLNNSPNSVHNVTLFYSTAHDNSISQRRFQYTEARFKNMTLWTTNHPAPQKLRPMDPATTFTPEWTMAKSPKPKSNSTFDELHKLVIIGHYFETSVATYEAGRGPVQKRPSPGQKPVSPAAPSSKRRKHNPRR